MLAFPATTPTTPNTFYHAGIELTTCSGYAIYYNVLVGRFKPTAIYNIGLAMIYEIGILDEGEIRDAILLTAAGLVNQIRELPGIAGNETAYNLVIVAGQEAFAYSYKIVYLVSIAFGGVSIIAACFLGNINQFMGEYPPHRLTSYLLTYYR